MESRRRASAYRTNIPHRTESSDSEAYSSPASFDDYTKDSSRRRSAREVDGAIDEDVALEDNVEVTEGGWMCQVQRYEKFVGSTGRNTVLKRISNEERLRRRSTNLEEPQKSDDQDEKSFTQKSVMSYVHYTPRTRRARYLELEIYIIISSPLLLQVLDKLLMLRPPDSKIPLLEIEEPYPQLWHGYNELEAYYENPENPQDTRRHLHVLLDFLRHCDMPNVSELVALCNSTEPVQTISFASSWFLFTPGTLVFDRDQASSEKMVMVVKSLTPPRREINRKGRRAYTDVRLDCQVIQYDGNITAYHDMSRSLKPFEGSRSISDLSVIPLKFLDSYEQEYRKLVLRGQKFWNLGGQHLREFRRGSGDNASAIDGERVMVDMELYLRQADADRRSKPPQRPRRPSDDIVEVIEERSVSDEEGTRVKSYEKTFKRLPLIEGELPEDDVVILCPSQIAAFSFHSKEWSEYNVDDIFEVDFNKKSFDRLVLRQDYKALLRAMVAQHLTQGENQFHDLIAGKGQGLNILLHGPPGVGKTLTAECIADLYERPLYSVTSGDIGTDPKLVESKLHQIFEYAVRWNAVLLLDEADVFLAERNLESLHRNGLVSVFLRMIEYFNGVFFMTTNRIGTIDEAFQSRLHITLGIDPLSAEDRRQIWYHFIKDLKHLSQESRRVLARFARDEWCQKDFNGRQIRNTVKTALTLARQDGVEVQARHFQTVLDIGSRFAGYMQRLKKMDKERLAEAIGTRLDLTTSRTQNAENSTIAQRSKRKSDDGSKDLDIDEGWD